MEIYFSMKSQSRFVVLMKQKARYEENIVNASQWLELIQYETQNPNWRDHVTEKLCKFVGVTR